MIPIRNAIALLTERQSRMMRIIDREEGSSILTGDLYARFDGNWELVMEIIWNLQDAGLISTGHLTLGISVSLTDAGREMLEQEYRIFGSGPTRIHRCCSEAAS